MQNKLLPCPFCGGESETKRERIRCSNRDCKLFNSEMNLLEWNTRAESEVSRYKKALEDTASILDTILKDAELRASDDGFQTLFNLKNKITQALEKASQ